MNEHITGDPYPAVDVRHDMLVDALEIIRGAFQGGYFTYRGDYLEVEDAKLFDLPETPPRIGITVSGKESCRKTLPKRSSPAPIPRRSPTG